MSRSHSVSSGSSNTVSFLFQWCILRTHHLCRTSLYPSRQRCPLRLRLFFMRWPCDEIRNMDCSRSSVVVVRGVQAKHFRRNSTASHLKTEFVLQGFLADDDLHIFTTGRSDDVEEVAKAVRNIGGDFAKAVLVNAEAKNGEVAD